MSILTKEERALKPDLIAFAEEGCGRPEYNCQEEDPIGEWCEPCLADIAARALDTIDALEARLDNSWALLENAHRDLAVIKAERDALEAERDEWIYRADNMGRRRKTLELFDQSLHPNGRCECEEGGWPCDWCSHPCDMCGIPRATGCGCDSECLGCREYAEQVRDLEAERDEAIRMRDHANSLEDEAASESIRLGIELRSAKRSIADLKAEAQSERELKDLAIGKVVELSMGRFSDLDALNAMTMAKIYGEHAELMADISKIETIARANHDTTTIGGAHAALREILAVIEGSDEEGER